MVDETVKEWELFAWYLPFVHQGLIFIVLFLGPALILVLAVEVLFGDYMIDW